MDYIPIVRDTHERALVEKVPKYQCLKEKLADRSCEEYLSFNHRQIFTDSEMAGA